MSNEERHRNFLPAFENDKELTAFARDYFSTHFPNPSRTGCPPPDDLRELISTHKTPSDELRRHLFGCSTCFQLYRKALAVQKDAVTGGSGWQQALVAFMRPSVLAPTIAVLALLIILGVWVRYVRDNRSGSYVASNSHTYSASPSTKQTQQSSDLSAEDPRTRINIDFNNYRVQRGGKNGENPTPEVSRTTVAFAITLPEGSAAGEYAVLLEDAYGTAVKKTSAQSSDGKTISVDVDLSKLVPQKYRLCVARKSESPNCYAINLK
jgi:hypothetical protein